MTASYRVFLKPGVEEDLRRIPKRDIRRIDKRILSLSAEPRPDGCKKLAGKDQYRIRQGNYRILYSVDDENLSVIIYKVQHRREVYRD